MLGVQKDDGEHLMRRKADAETEKVAHGVGRVEHSGAGQRLRHAAAHQFHRQSHPPTDLPGPASPRRREWRHESGKTAGLAHQAAQGVPRRNAHEGSQQLDIVALPPLAVIVMSATDVRVTLAPMQTPAPPPTRHFVLGITGGIAAYKSAELVRLWVRQGHTVDVVMTPAAKAFVGPVTFQALSGRAVRDDLWHGEDSGMDHIALSRNVDAVIVAPASADFIGKLAHGLADDLLSTLCLARDCPLLVVPAMNRQMWENRATQRNVAQLRADGVAILGPATGEQACGEVGAGRMIEPEEIVWRVEGHLLPKPLAGRRVLVTSGPTYEPLDPVRAIVNRSSGRMGHAIAAAARDAGAQVTLVSGPVALPPPGDVRTLNVETAAEMLTAVENELEGTDIFVSVAAVSDYRSEHRSEHKIKRDGSPLQLDLLPNPDILAAVAARPGAPFCVGFAAESEDLLANAEAKRQRKQLPLLVANDTSAIGSAESRLHLLDDHGIHTLPAADKAVSGRWVVDHIAQLFKHRERH